MSINEFSQAHKNRRRTRAMLALMQRGLRVECVNVVYKPTRIQYVCSRDRVSRTACIVNVLSYVNGKVPQVVACAMCECYPYAGNGWEFIAHEPAETQREEYLFYLLLNALTATSPTFLLLHHHYITSGCR